MTLAERGGDRMGKTAVVTGATAGIGLCAARMLAAKGIEVIGVGRSEERCASAAESIEGSCGKRPRYVVGDLATTEGVRKIAEGVGHLLGEDEGRLDILMNIAGAVASWHTSSAENYELQFAVNHLAPFLLTRELLLFLRRSQEARILVVSSESHRHARVRWDDVMMRRRYSLLAAYKQSKLCNALFVAELARRLRSPSISAYAIDPGLARTDLGLKGTFGIERMVWKLRRLQGVEPEVPARHMVEVATEAYSAGRSGLYWKGGRPIEPDRRVRDAEAAGRLWALSERLCGIEDAYFRAPAREAKEEPCSA
jgi:NAD(P)-dependent dehydrogenase (short-subunit alcohol dehydrogenase family)